MGIAVGLYGAFTGQQQRSDAKKSYRASNALLDAGADKAGGIYGDYLARTLGHLAPYGQSGADAQSLYRQALGLDGDEAQRDFHARYAYDPFRQSNEATASRGLERRMSALGMLGSGAHSLAAARASLERGSTDYNAYLDRLAGLSGQGAGIAGQMAGYTSGAGNQLADLYWQQAQQKAGNRVQLGNAISQSRAVPFNNLMALGEVASKFMGPG